MNRFNKIIFSLIVMCVPLLLSSSFAYPDLYFYNNYFSGTSPVYMNEEDNSIYYYPSGNYVTDMVYSFDNTFMSGVPGDPTALPFLDLDYTIGKVFAIEPGQCMAVSSLSGQFSKLHVLGDVTGVAFGATGFTNSGFTGGFIKNTSGNSASDRVNLTGSEFTLDIHDRDAFYLTSGNYTTGEFTIGESGTNEVNSTSFVWALFNFSDSTSYFTVSEELYESTEITYVADTIPVDNVSIILSHQSYDVPSNAFVTFVPHINGYLDVYGPSSLSTGVNEATSYRMQVYYNVRSSFSLDSDNNLVVGIDYINKNCYSTTTVPLDSITPTKNVPLFISYRNAIKDYSYAVYIKDGYLSITNYEDLVALLKENGIGQTDLSRITQLLEEINTGGSTGEEAKELIDILESYHDQLISQANFGEVTNVFDLYKNLLDFSSDMHWLITANNALFNYFAGFVMLCAMFLILNRILR